MQKQHGYIYPASDWWYLKYRDWIVTDGKLERKQLVHKLAPIAPEDKRLKRPPQYIEELGAEFLAPLNNGKVDPHSTQTLEVFVRDVFFPHRNKAASTIHTDRNRWEKHLAPRVGSIRIRDFRTVDANNCLSEIARSNSGLSRATLKQLKSLLSAIFKAAKRLGLRDGVNPVADSSVPDARGKANTPVYDGEQVSAILNVLPLREATIITVAAFAGLSRSEIQGLTIASDQGNVLSIDRSVWEGVIGKTKTEERKATVPIIPQLRHILDMYKKSLNPSELAPGAPLFAASNGKPLRLHNVELRTVVPSLIRCETCRKREDEHQQNGHEFKLDPRLPEWKGWHAFRRGLATRLHEQGVPDIVIQKILRHKNVKTTQACYIKTEKQAARAMSDFGSSMPEVVYNCDINPEPTVQ